MRFFLPLLLLLALLLAACGEVLPPTPLAPARANTQSAGNSQAPGPQQIFSVRAIQDTAAEATAVSPLSLPSGANARLQTVAGTPAGWTPLLDDDFGDPDDEMWATGEIEGGAIALEEGELRIHAEHGWHISTYPTAAAQLGDSYIAASFEVEGQGIAGVMARLTAGEDDSSMYICWLEEPAWFGCHRRSDGTWTRLVQSESSAVNTNGANTIALQIVGNNLLFYINGQAVASFVDGTLRGGAWGVFAEGGVDTLTAHFSHVLIAVPGEDQAAPTPAQSRPTPTAGADGNLVGLDPAFGDSGKVTLEFGSGSDEAHALVVQPDGKIVVGGEAWPGGNPNFALARLNPDGSLDSSFGDGGKVITTLIDEYDYSGIRALALQPDGKLLATGPARNPETRRPAFGLVRYNKDGKLDRSFGDGGKVITRMTLHPAYNIADEAQALAIAPDGKILVAGSVGGFPSDFGLARYLPNGRLDSSFGDGGRVITDFGYEDKALALAIAPGGRILVAGYGSLQGESVEANNFALARYNADGSLDRTFGQGGKVTTDLSQFQDWANGIVLRPDGKIVLGGLAVNSARGCNGASACWQFGMALAQYNANGSLDTSFGDRGKVIVPDQWSAGNALLRRADGSLVLGGFVGETDFGLAIFDANGKPLSGFGNHGILRTSFGIYKDYSNALALQPDGRIVAAGRAAVDPSDILNSDFALVRYK